MTSPEPAARLAPSWWRARPELARPPFARSILARPTFGGTLGALVLWWLSLNPTLLPRDWSMQAAVSAVCIAIGYALGTLAGYLGHRVLAALHQEPSRDVRRSAWFGLAIVAAALVVLGLVLWVVWQNDQRDLVQMEHIGAVVILPMVLATAVLVAVLVVVGRLIGYLVRRFDHFLVRHIPPVIAHGAALVVAVVVGVLLTNDVLFDSFVRWSNSRFATFDTTTAPGIEQPTADTVSGSPSSLVPWDTLGYEGRNFVATATTEEEFLAFFGAGADHREPVRAYAGLRSADSLQERAALAVRDLERAGGFDRDVLGVVTVTGTGWVDPDAARALELLRRGDTAIVALQYSYLPSWISFLVDRDKARDAGQALNDAVHARWSQLPENDRPELVVFGESLGSFGAEADFEGDDAAASVAQLVERTEGALFVGPTDSNPIWEQLQAAREPGSPTWRPVYDGGTTVQFANRPSDLQPPDPAWRDPKVLYVHHPSDPVGVWNWQTLWAEPAWVRPPVGYDVPSRVTWVPIVTWVQEVADLVAGFSAPAGHGHNYANDMAAAWAALVPPDGWTADDTARLAAYLTTITEPD